MDNSTPDGAIAQANGHTPTAIPDELMSYVQWASWHYANRSGNLTKVLSNPHTGNNASVDKPDTWGTFEQAVVANEKYEGNGIGIVFTEDDLLAGVDLDDCRDPDTGVIHPEAQAIVDELNSYTEVSPSGTGLHIILYGVKPGSRCNTGNTPWGGKIELYDSGRFFTVTGQHLPSTPTKVCSRQKAFAGLYERFFGTTKPTPTASPASGVSPLTDDGLIAEAERINGDKFRRLFYGGDISDYEYDDSRGRAALIGIIRWFAHDDPDQIERIIRRSKLDQSKFDHRRGSKPFIQYEIDNWLAKGPLSNGYYELQPDLPSEFVSVHYINPHGQKRNETEDAGDSGFVSVHGQGVYGQKQKLSFKSFDELAKECGDEPDWIAQGFLACGWLSDLSGRAKNSGKTTLITHMARSVLDGRPFLDYPTTKTNVVYLTEQASSVVETFKKAGLDIRNDGLKILPWKDVRGYPWPELVEGVAEYANDFGAGLVVIDTLNRFAGLKGEDENSAGAVAGVMAELMAAAQAHNIAILSIRHANKEGKARGSTQFDHDVDALFELKRPDGNMGDNVRILEGIGRSDDIPGKLTIELGPDGYKNLGSGDSVRFKMAVRAIREEVSKDPGDPTPKTALEAALQEDHGIALVTGRRAVKWLCDQGDLVQLGEGKRGSPYMYFMPPLEVDIGRG